MSSEKPLPQADSFAALFEQSKNDTPKRRTVRVGETLDAVVVQVGKETVFLELDGKRQAFIEADEVRAPDGTMNVAVGDTLRARVVEVDGAAGTVRLGRTLGRASGSAAVEQAKASGLPLEGKVVAVNKGGLEIDLAGTRAFCPISQADAHYVEDPKALIGKSMEFAVVEVRDGGKNVIVSRRALLERDAKEAAARVLKTIIPGAVLKGTVRAVRDFGAFVDLGGVEGLIPAKEIGHDRGVAVSSAVAVGDVVEVQVLDVKDADPAAPGGKGKERRITLSLKALAKDPWEALDVVAPVGKVVSGVVARVVDFGAFVKLAPGVEGLLHVSELGSKARALTVGQAISVVVRQVDAKEKRISLVPAPEGVGAGATVNAPKLTVGAIVAGAVDRIETYGVFVQIEGTSGRAGRGLVPSAELGVPRGTDLRKTFPEGTKVRAKIVEIADGKIRLSLRAAKDDDERAEFEGFREKARAPEKLGTLGDLLLKGKKPRA